MAKAFMKINVDVIMREGAEQGSDTLKIHFFGSLAIVAASRDTVAKLLYVVLKELQ